MEINNQAPVVAPSKVEIAASPQIVWDVISDINAWPNWNPEVKEASLSGGLAEGSTFKWKAGPGTITSTIQRIDPPHLLGWTGKTLGINAVDVFRLTTQGNNTVVTEEESWEGFPVRILRGRMKKMLQDSLDAGLQRLKAESERRASA